MKSRYYHKSTGFLRERKNVVEFVPKVQNMAMKNIDLHFTTPEYAKTSIFSAPNIGKIMPIPVKNGMIGIEDYLNIGI